MVFNSIWYAMFLWITCIVVYKLPKKLKYIALFCTNIFFFATNSFASIIILVIVLVVSYLASVILERKKNRLILVSALIIVFAPLFLFKYINMFLSTLGFPNITGFQVLPVGISFYTFSAAGYLIDVYKCKYNAEKNIVIYAIFISLFCYFGGPIERGNNILPQLQADSFGTINDKRISMGLEQLLRGCFFKVFVADNIAQIVNPVYANIYSASAIRILIATVLFGFQLYCDFYGYSLMAQGSANVLGLEIISNFKQPYLSVSVTDFWRRWHISLSSWFRDYVYFPLGGSRCGILRRNMNRLITFLLSGIWHGANWTFAIWGGINGVYLIIEDFLGLKSVNKTGIPKILGRLYTFILINFSWVFFRANSIKDAIYALESIVIEAPHEFLLLVSGELSVNSVLNLNISDIYIFCLSFLGIFIVSLLDVYQNKCGNLEIRIPLWNKLIKTVYLIVFAFLVMVFGVWTSSGNFIYLNF